MLCCSQAVRNPTERPAERKATHHMATNITRPHITAKCQACHRNERQWMMQPWGPDERVIFTIPGAHYRGFATVAICDECKQQVEAGQQVTFAYKRQSCTLNEQHEQVAAAAGKRSPRQSRE